MRTTQRPTRNQKQGIEIVTVYRVQPVGLNLGNHKSETSNETLDVGSHVFAGLQELQGGVNGWTRQDYTPEIVVIECDEKDIKENGDYEGFVLVANRGEIVKRIAFPSWGAFAALCRDYEVVL